MLCRCCLAWRPAPFANARGGTCRGEVASLVMITMREESAAECLLAQQGQPWLKPRLQLR